VKRFYCQISTPGPNGTRLTYQGEGSSKRVAAQRAIAKLIEETTPGAYSRWNDVRIIAGGVGA
jgi:hypothetical protein